MNNNIVLAVIVIAIILVGIIVVPKLINSGNVTKIENIENKEIERLEQSNHLVDGSLYSKPSNEEIKSKLEPDQYKITQQSDTEKAFTHVYNKMYEKGIYVDVVTGEPLFSSDDKFDSGTGWPSFTKPIDSAAINNVEDRKLGMKRVEVKSRIGDSHLGHVFDDGPTEAGGKRYCLNGGALKFIPYEDMEQEGYGSLKDIFK